MPSLFDLSRVPFSTFGSWMSISVPRDEDDLFVRNHHGGANNLFPLKTVADGRVVAPAVDARPWVLRLTHGNGSVEICFENPGTFRMRGRGLGLRLGARNLAYSDGELRAVINCPFTRRYQIEVMSGDLDLSHVDLETPEWAKQATVTPASDGEWELAIDEFESTWTARTRAPFDRCVASAERAWTRFADAMPRVRPRDEQAQRLAVYVDWSCAVEPCGLVKRPSLLMSKNWMNNIWSWDHCFNAMALAAGHPEPAMDQMLTMVDHQDEFGCYPDSINDVKITYNFSKPPVHGLALREVLRRLPHPPSGETLSKLWTSLNRQAGWWMTHRRLPGSPLPYYLHGNDSGWDNSTMFSQGVPLEAPDLAALLSVQMDVLAELAPQVGKPAEALRLRNEADGLADALVKELWRGDHFVARLGNGLGNDTRDVESASLIPWMPIILGKRLPDDILSKLARGIEGHLTEWGLATERVDSSRYREDGYWQGPIWAPSTYLVVAGLAEAGFDQLADDIAERFCRLCGKSGFAENFNAVTGEPLRDPAYTWTASVFLLLAERLRS